MSEEQNEVVEVEDEKPQGYDPDQILNKAGQLQNKVMDGLLKMNTDDLVNDAKTLDAVASMVSAISGTAVQVKKMGTDTNDQNMGAIADAMLDRMKERGFGFVRRADPNNMRDVTPPQPVIELDEDQVVEVGMLQRGLVTTTYGEFAREQGMNEQEDDD